MSPLVSITRRGVKTGDGRESNSNQLRGLVQMAKDTGKPFELVISPRNNHMSQPLWDLIEREGGSVTQFNPATGRFTTVTSKPTLPR